MSNKTVKKGQLVTSEQPVTKAAPMRPQSQGGQLVGGYPASFGVKGKAKAGRPAKVSRKKMY